MLRLAAAVAALALSSTVSAVSSTFVYPQPSQSCVSGVHMIVARASGESEGIGILKGVTDQIIKMVPNSDAVSVNYPATIPDYQFSEQEGVVGMKQLVTEYVQKCPNSKIVLLGYSQGAQVVGDTVIGSDENNFSDDTTNPTGLGKQYLEKIAGLVMMGDPAFNTTVPGKQGNSTKNGVFSRRNVAAFTQYGFNDKMRSYCDEGDLYCASGSGKDATAIHVGYINEYGADAAKFVAGLVGGSSSGGSSASGASGSTTSGSAGGSGSSSASAGSASRTSTQASATKASSAGGSGSSSKASTTGTAAAAANVNPLTSNRYHPVTTTFLGTFSQLGDLPNAGGIYTLETGLAGAVFGAAMFLMGLL